MVAAEVPRPDVACACVVPVEVVPAACSSRYEFPNHLVVSRSVSDCDAILHAVLDYICCDTYAVGVVNPNTCGGPSNGVADNCRGTTRCVNPWRYRRSSGRCGCDHVQRQDQRLKGLAYDRRVTRVVGEVTSTASVGLNHVSGHDCAQSAWRPKVCQEQSIGSLVDLEIIGWAGRPKRSHMLSKSNRYTVQIRIGFGPYGTRPEHATSIQIQTPSTSRRKYSTREGPWPSLVHELLAPDLCDLLFSQNWKGGSCPHHTS